MHKKLSSITGLLFASSQEIHAWSHNRMTFIHNPLYIPPVCIKHAERQKLNGVGRLSGDLHTTVAVVVADQTGQVKGRAALHLVHSISRSAMSRISARITLLWATEMTFLGIMQGIFCWCCSIQEAWRFQEIPKHVLACSEQSHRCYANKYHAHSVQTRMDNARNTITGLSTKHTKCSTCQHRGAPLLL